MKYFWPWFFAFILATLLLIGLFRPDLMDGALMFLGFWFTLLLYFILGIIVLGMVIFAALFWKKKINDHLRERDGHYALQKMRLGRGRTAIIDPNQVVGPGIIIDRRTNAIEEIAPAAGWQVQSVVRLAVEKTRQIQAIYPGDDARRNRFGAMARTPGVTVGTARVINGYGKPAPPPAHDASHVELPAPSVRVVDPVDAFANNTHTSFALGQADDGQIVRWNANNAPHLRIHGATQGSGKTNLARTIAAGALQRDAHVLVLDRRRFKDWADLAGNVELVDTRNPEAFAAAMTRVMEIYQQRDVELGAAGVGNIGQAGGNHKRIIIIISEFGSLCDVAKGDGVLDDALYPLKLVMREAGATGIHVIIEDQIVDEKWPRGVVANAVPITGYLPLNYGSSGGYHHSHNLAAYDFHFNGQRFHTWEMTAAIPRMKSRIPPLNGFRVIDGEAVHGRVHETVHAPVHDRSPEVAPPLFAPRTERTVPVAAPAVDRDPARWQALVDSWFSRHPEALNGPARGISDIARLMSREATGTDDYYENYKSIAHKMFHDFRDNVHYTV